MKKRMIDMLRTLLLTAVLLTGGAGSAFADTYEVASYNGLKNCEGVSYDSGNNTITLGADIIATVGIAIPEDITIDLNGYNITGNNGNVITIGQGFTLTIVDNSYGTVKGSIIQTNENGGFAITGNDGSTLVANGVTFTCANGCVIYSNVSTLTLTGCTITGHDGITSGGETIITGCTITGHDGITSDGETIITGCTFNCSGTAIEIPDGTLALNTVQESPACTINGAEYGLVICTGVTVTIGSNVIFNQCKKSAITHDGSKFVFEAWPIFGTGENKNASDIKMFQGRVITFGDDITGAPDRPIAMMLGDVWGNPVSSIDPPIGFTSNYSEKVKENGNVIDPNRVFVYYDDTKGFSFGIDASGVVNVGKYAASVTVDDGVNTPTISYHATLSAALTAAKSEFDTHSGSTPAVVPKVTLFDDVTGITSSIRLGSEGYNCDLVLDLNGHTLSGNHNFLIVVGSLRTLTVEDSGKDGRIVNNSTYAIYNYGTLNLHGVTIGGLVTSIENHGAMTVSGGTIDMSVAHYGIENYGTLTFNGLPKFEHGSNTSAIDIYLSNGSAITFGAGTYEAPENPIIVECDNNLPYTFTEGYSENVLDKYGYVIDPYRVFSYVGVTSDYQVTFDELDGEATIYHGAADVELADDADNSKKLVMGKYCNVTLADRTITYDGTWNTLCLPFDVTLSGSPLQGFTVKKLNASISSLDRDGQLTLIFTDVTDKIVAGKPYILSWPPTGIAPVEDPVLVFSGVTITSTEPEAVTFSNDLGDPCQFVGQYSPFEINDGTATEGFDSNVNNIDEILFLTSVAAKGKTLLGYSQSPRVLRPCRAHFYVPAVITESGDEPVAVRSVTMNFGDGTDATGVVELKNSRIEELNSDDGWYSMDGRRLQGKPAQKGVYIHQGRKIVVK